MNKKKPDRKKNGSSIKLYVVYDDIQKNFSDFDDGNFFVFFCSFSSLIKTSIFFWNIFFVNSQDQQINKKNQCVYDDELDYYRRFRHTRQTNDGR